MKHLFSAISICLLTLSNIFGQLPEDFSIQNVSSGWDGPVGMEFFNDSIYYVYERAGKVYQVTNDVKSETPVIDISEEVGSWGDMGMLGMALHPDFKNNGQIFLSYCVDRYHLLYIDSADYDPEKSDYFSATIGRVTRYTIDTSDYHSLKPNSRKVLIGDSIHNGIPSLSASHLVGSLAFGRDTTLLVATGDGNTFIGYHIGKKPYPAYTYDSTAIANNIIKKEEEIGSYRAQYVKSLNGKILRINPDNGEGIESNPFYDSSSPKAAQSRVWALGFRNPFRMSLKPHTGSPDPANTNPGTLFIGDVGFYSFEELNICDGPGQNFGWPKYEGMGPAEGYSWLKAFNLDYPNLFRPDWCGEYYLTFQSLVKTTNESHTTKFFYDCTDIELPESVITFNHERPAMTYMNAYSVEDDNNVVLRPGYDNDGEPVADTLGVQLQGFDETPFTGISAVAGTFYDGDAFPAEYRSSFFMADYNGWVKRFEFNENNELTNIYPFIDDAGAVVDIKSNPYDGCLYYVTIFPAEVNKICYGGNRKPVAAIEVSEEYGPSPLEVSFSSSGSYDPDEETLTYHWDFGNGETSTEENPTVEFAEDAPNIPKSFTVTLTVEDESGAKDVVEKLIAVNNTPPQIEITGADSVNYYSSEDFQVYNLNSIVTDNEHTDEEIEKKWYLILHHNEHFHIENEYEEDDLNLTTSPIGCDVEKYWYKVVFKATDAGGLSSIDTLLFYPDCPITDTTPDNLQDILVGPNPFNDWIILYGKNMKESQISELSLTDALGSQENLLLKSTVFEDHIIINSVGRKPGIYILKMVVGDSVFVKKLTKR